MLGNSIRHYRRQKKLTQQELAQLVSCSIDSVKRWENGVREPKASDIKKLCAVLECTESDLLNGPNDGKIRITLSYDWEKFQKGELEMDGNLFEVFLGGHGEVGIKGSGLPKSREELEELKQRMCKELDKAFDYQLERGAIQLA